MKDELDMCNLKSMGMYSRAGKDTNSVQNGGCKSRGPGLEAGWGKKIEIVIKGG